MRDVAQELPASPLRRFQREGHLVEGRGELGELVRAGDRDTVSVAAFRDPRRGGGERAHGPDDPQREKRAHRAGGCHGGRDGKREGEEHGVPECLVEVAGDVLRDDPEGVADVPVEETGRDGECHEREREGARQNHEKLRGEQLGGEAASEPAHAPVPIR